MDGIKNLKLLLNGQGGLKKNSNLKTQNKHICILR
jgi:hypothetical protein